MSCLPCSKVPTDQKGTIKYYKDLYKNKGKETYVYRLKKNGDLLIVSKENFNSVFFEKIKPNFINGAEYFHISEFKTN